MIRVVVVLLAMVAMTVAALAQDPVKVAPNSVVLENGVGAFVLSPGTVER